MIHLHYDHNEWTQKRFHKSSLWRYKKGLVDKQITNKLQMKLYEDQYVYIINFCKLVQETFPPYY